MKKIIVFALIGLTLMVCINDHKPIKIFLIGDSTMATKAPEVFPETGWGQVLPQYFNDNVVIENHAVNGRSSKSFLDEGRWKVVLDSLKEGDYVFIQFGHNDQKIDSPERYTAPYKGYTKNLLKYVRETRAKGAIPILFTSIVRRKFDDAGKLIDTHGDYPKAMRKMARKTKVPLIDMQKMTAELVQSLGAEKSKELYLWTEPNDQFPKGRQDDTHLCTEGAMQIAKLAVDALVKKGKLFEKYLKE